LGFSGCPRPLLTAAGIRKNMGRIFENMRQAVAASPNAWPEVLVLSGTGENCAAETTR